MPSKRKYNPRGGKLSTSPYLKFRLKRTASGKGHFLKNKIYIKNVSIKVQQKGKNAWNNNCWISLGTFDTENAAVDFLTQQAEMMRQYEIERGLLE